MDIDKNRVRRRGDGSELTSVSVYGSDSGSAKEAERKTMTIDVEEGMMHKLVIGAAKLASMARIIDESSMRVASKGKALQSAEEFKVGGRRANNGLEGGTLRLNSMIEGILPEGGPQRQTRAQP